MSLVYEALQKAEREKNRSAGIAPVPPTAPVVKPPALRQPLSPPPSTAPARSHLVIPLVGISLIAVAAIAYLLGVTFVSRPVTAGLPAIPKADEPPRAAVSEPSPSVPMVTPPLPANSTANDPRFKLTGIMMGDNSGAVINGRVVYKNQYVDGAIVKRVERDRVTLNVDGREIVVRLH